MKNKIESNYIYNMTYQLFTIIIPLITTPYISRVLGADMLGVYSYTLSISTYFIIAGSLGYPLYGQREIAYCADKREVRSVVFFEIIYGQLALLIMSLLLYFTLVIVINSEYKLVYYAQSFGIIGSICATSWFYIGIEELKVTVTKNIIVKTLSVIGLFLFVKCPEDVTIYAVIVGMSNLLGNIVILIDIRKYVDFRNFRVKLRDIIKHLKPAFLLGIPYYITSVYAIIDKTMLGLMGNGYAEVGYYEQSQKIITLVIMVITSIGTVLMPRLANELANNNIDIVKYYLNKGVRWCMLLAVPIMFGLFALSDMVVPWFFGMGYEPVRVLLIIFAPLALIMGIGNLIGTQYLTVVKREKQLIVIIIVGVITNCILNALLIPLYNSVGASIATVVSEFIKLVMQIVILNGVLYLNEHLQSLFKYGLISLVMFIIIMILKFKVFIVPNFINSMLLSDIGILIYIILLLTLKDEFMYRFLKKLQRK